VVLLFFSHRDIEPLENFKWHFPLKEESKEMTERIMRMLLEKPYSISIQYLKCFQRFQIKASIMQSLKYANSMRQQQ